MVINKGWPVPEPSYPFYPTYDYTFFTNTQFTNEDREMLKQLKSSGEDIFDRLEFIVAKLNELQSNQDDLSVRVMRLQNSLPTLRAGEPYTIMVTSSDSTTNAEPAEDNDVDQRRKGRLGSDECDCASCRTSSPYPDEVLEVEAETSTVEFTDFEQGQLAYDKAMMKMGFFDKPAFVGENGRELFSVPSPFSLPNYVGYTFTIDLTDDEQAVLKSFFEAE